MFKNPGKKIKTLAKVLCWLGIIFSVLMGLVVIAAGNLTVNGAQVESAGAGVVTGVVWMIVGALGSWISALCLYGFGHLIVVTEEMRDGQKPENN